MLNSVLKCRVAIVGGGPAGLAIALHLSNLGIESVLIEKDRFEGVRIGEHLGPTARVALQQLNVPQIMLGEMHYECPRISSFWGSDQVSEQDYIFGPYGLGMNLSRPAFDQVLGRLVAGRGGRVLLGFRFRQLEGHPGHWVLTVADLSQSIQIHADFVVDATGRTAVTASFLSCSRVIYDNLVGVVAYLQPRCAGCLPSAQGLRVESTLSGWWYSAQLKDGRSVAAYMTDGDLMTGAPKPVEAWQQALSAASGTAKWLSHCVKPKAVIVRSARTQRLEYASAPGWLAVGDAAMSFDPLSSTGIEKGLTHGTRAAEAIRDYFADERQTLTAYDQELQVEFIEYLEQRGHYYRAEQRWAGQDFWKRRHAPLPWEEPFTLSPWDVLSPAEGADIPAVQSRLTHDFPGLCRAGIVDLAQGGLPAYEVARRYQDRRLHPFPDHFLIAGLQELVKACVLQRKPTPEKHQPGFPLH